MARKKKRSLAGRAAVGTLKGAGWILGGAAKLAWKGAKGATKAAADAHKRSKVKKQQPQTPSSYAEFDVSTTVKGTVDSFVHRLHNESLIVAVAGRRGSGKSVLGFRLLENINAKTKRPCFALGVKQSVLPSWITSIEDLSEVSNNGIVLVDEGAISFSSRKSMSKENKALSEILAIARHKDLTLFFITQNTGMLDKNVLNLCDVILLKEGSLLQEKMERSVMRDLYKTANDALKEIPAKDRKSYCYVFDAEFEGIVGVSLPSFWSTRVSKNQA